MKLSITILSALLMSLSLTAATVKLDTGKSKVNWLGTKVTGKHNGTVNVKSGELKIEKGILKSGVVTVDMKTIKVTDGSPYSEKLVAHLNSNDFFAVDVKGNDVATFTTNSIKAMGKGKYKVEGSLMIKKKKAPVNLILNEKGGQYTGELKFDRTKYDIRYGSGNFFSDLGDKMIHDEVVLNITLVPKK
jgi:polyisoprenoid-binding protein YceI